MALTPTVEWALEAPRQALPRLPFEMISSISPTMVLISALASVAIGDCWLTPALSHRLPSTIFLYFLDTTVWIFMVSRVSRLWKTPPNSFQTWWRVGAFAAVPMHLVLPAALLLRPLGPSGFLLAEGVKLGLFFMMARRWVWAIEVVNDWPAWAATLLVASPMVIMSLGMLLALLATSGALLVAALGVLK